MNLIGYIEQQDFIHITTVLWAECFDGQSVESEVSMSEFESQGFFSS